VIAAVAVTWYFSHGGADDTKGQASIMIGFRWIFKYHMGSIAFGALIIAIMQMIKLAFEYFRKKMLAGNNNKCMQAIICAVRCYIWSIDYYIRFLTKNAYI
jgi:hypothetical protein